MLQERSNKLAKVSEVYAENTVLRALINTIPYIGSSLDILFASKEAVQQLPVINEIHLQP
jgi:hypothetical protein